MRNLTECPACGGERIRPEYRHRDRLFREWNVFRCENCTHGFINPQPCWDELAPYYESSYPAYGEMHGASESDDDDVVREAQMKGEFRCVPIRAGMRLLDVGCGGGYFLRIAQRLGATVEGVEPNEHGAATAREAGLSVYCGTIESFAAEHPEKRFDIVTTNHVMEHIPDPVPALSAMRSLVGTDGIISVVVPNAGCYACRSLKGRWHSTDLPRHLMQFTDKSLIECARRAGLRPSKIFTYSLPKAVAGSVRQWLRYRLFVPIKVSRFLRIIDRPIAQWVGARLDGANTGEALIARFIAA